LGSNWSNISLLFGDTNLSTFSWLRTEYYNDRKLMQTRSEPQKAGCKILYPFPETKTQRFLQDRILFTETFKLFWFRSSVGWNQASRLQKLSQASFNNPEL